MCEICSSSLLDDVNKKINWRPDRVVKWAGKRGLIINEKQLENHFEKHVDPENLTKSKTGKKVSGKKKTDPGQKKLSAKTDTHKEQPVVLCDVRSPNLTSLNGQVRRLDRTINEKNKAGKTVQRKKKVDLKQKKPSAKPNTRQSVATSDASDRRYTADNRLLSEVINQVFASLIEGNYNLKIEHGFKAVELKQKLSDNSDVETLLLDLLNEIRRQELESNR